MPRSKDPQYAKYGNFKGRVTDGGYELIHFMVDYLEWSPSATAKILSLGLKTVKYWLERDHPPSQTVRQLAPKDTKKKRAIAQRRKKLVNVKQMTQTVTRERFTPKTKKRVTRTVELPVYSGVRDFARGLKNHHNINVSKTTVYNDLRATGFRAKKQRTAPPLSEKQKEERVEFCKWCIKNLDDGALCFSDECWVTNNPRKKKHQWCAPDEHPNPNPQDPHPFKVMVWLAVAKGRRRIHVIDCNGAEKTVTAERYERDVLQKALPFLEALSEDNILLQEDNARTHKAADWLKRRGIKTLASRKPWPALSPDLSPVEQVNQWVKDAVQKGGWYGPTELAAAAEKAFNNLDQSSIDAVVDSFRHRCQMVIDAGGNTIKPPRSAAAKKKKTKKKKNM